MREIERKKGEIYSHLEIDVRSKNVSEHCASSSYFSFCFVSVSFVARSLSFIHIVCVSRFPFVYLFIGELRVIDSFFYWTLCIINICRFTHVLRFTFPRTCGSMPQSKVIFLIVPCTFLPYQRYCE